MPFAQMYQEITGSVPNVDVSYAATLVNEAWEDVRRLGGWSFQFQQDGFSVPGIVNQGTVTLTFNSATVVGDTNAAAAWNSVVVNFLTQRQFRQLGGTIYNIVAYDGVNTLTLDRPFTDPLPAYTGPQSSISYMIYQPYFVAPVKDFRRWYAFLDQANTIWLKLNYERKKVDIEDPKRQIFSNPLVVIPFTEDLRITPASGSTPAQPYGTYGFMQYELYPQPTAVYCYQRFWERFGADLVNPTDTLPFPITEQLVKARARVRAYEQAEANKDPLNPRGTGADFRFLMGAAMKQYEDELKRARLVDRDRIDMFFTTMTRFGAPAPLPFYNQQTGVLNISNFA